MRRAVVAVAAAAVLASTFAVTRGNGDTGSERALIPAYLPPSGIEALAMREAKGSVMILNPASGPGAAANAAYARAVAVARKRGWKVIGYVPTSYAARDLAAVEADARHYAAWYHVDGIFLDEATHDATHVAYYRELRARIPGLLVINPGMVPDPSYMGTADVIVTYEGPAGGHVPAPGWLPAERSARLVYGAPEEHALELARAHEAGYLYVTSQTLPDPWSALPGYLDDELRALMG